LSITHFTVPLRVEGWVYRVDWLRIEMVYNGRLFVSTYIVRAYKQSAILDTRYILCERVVKFGSTAEVKDEDANLPYNVQGLPSTEHDRDDEVDNDTMDMSSKSKIIKGILARSRQIVSCVGCLEDSSFRNHEAFS